jgi:hypothetical protein
LVSPLLNPPEDTTPKEPDPRERELLRQRLKQVAEEKKAALLDVGPTWREWAYYEAFKWWLALVLLIVDSWIIVQWFSWGSELGLTLTLGLAIYAEYLLYRYLWTRPPPPATRRHEPFRRTWYRPVEIGRWTPEAAFLRSHGGQGSLPDEGPSPEEFL